jgi:hypothetical protein
MVVPHRFVNKALELGDYSNQIGALRGVRLHQRSLFIS